MTSFSESDFTMGAEAFLNSPYNGKPDRKLSPIENIALMAFIDAVNEMDEDYNITSIIIAHLANRDARSALNALDKFVEEANDRNNERHSANANECESDLKRHGN